MTVILSTVKSELILILQVLNYEMEEKSYTHLDFLWGVHNYHNLYHQTLILMEKFH